jgi:hypothetical protein
MSRNAYMRAYMAQRYLVRMAAATERLGGACVDCGKTTRLEFDHLDPSQKEFPITKACTIREDRFWAEVDKCVLRCRTCHEKKTLRDRRRDRKRLG